MPRPDRLLVAAGVATCTLFLLSIGWLQVARVAKRKVDATISRAGKKLGVPIDIGKWTITPTGAHFDDVRLGVDDNVIVSRMTAEVGLNPFSESFGELDGVVLEQIRVKGTAAGVKGELDEIGPLGQPAAGDKADRLQRLGAALEKVFKVLPAERLLVQGGGVELVDDDGKELLEIKGLKLLVEKRPNRILFRMQSVHSDLGVDEENVQGRFELQPKGAGYRFFVRRKATASSKVNAWAVSGTVPKDFDTLQLKIEARRLPSLLERRLAEYLGAEPRLNLRASVDAARDGDGWRFSTRVKSLGTTVSIPLVSSRPIGPAHFDLTAKGFVKPDEKLFAIESAELLFPARQTGRYGKSPVRFTASGAGRLLGAEEGGFSAQGHIALAPTPCQSLLDASPPGLLPALQEFRLNGHAAASLDFNYDGKKPEAAGFDLKDEQYGCKVVETPFAYSAEHLSGPFKLTREVVKDEPPIELDIGPLSSTYTPLESIAKTTTQAFVSSEDASFFSHRGIDAAALAQAVKRDLAERRVAVGGSTITMQTAKNLFLTPDRTLSRKLQELFLAWHLENVLSKERILEIYMNIVELGPGIYGITQASEHFFGKHPYDLTLLESAYLATLLPNPKARYRYFCDGRLTPNYRDMVNGLLKRMLGLNRIPWDRYNQAMHEDVQFNEQARLGSKECRHPVTASAAEEPPPP